MSVWDSGRPTVWPTCRRGGIAPAAEGMCAQLVLVQYVCVAFRCLSAVFRNTCVVLFNAGSAAVSQAEKR